MMGQGGITGIGGVEPRRPVFAEDVDHGGTQLGGIPIFPGRAQDFHPQPIAGAPGRFGRGVGDIEPPADDPVALAGGEEPEQNQGREEAGGHSARIVIHEAVIIGQYSPLFRLIHGLLI
jgi:hypothetical protein